MPLLLSCFRNTGIYLIACGLVGAPTAPVKGSGAAARQIAFTNRIAIGKGFNTLEARDIQQDAARDEFVCDSLNAIASCATGGDFARIIAIPHLAMIKDVRETIPVGSTLQRRGHQVIGTTDPIGKGSAPSGPIASILQHHMHWIKAVHVASLQPVVIQWYGKRKDLALFHEAVGLSDFLCGDVVQSTELILGSPLAPVAVLFSRLIDHRFRCRHRPFLSLLMRMRLKSLL
jgi:hypothetical protein